MKDSLTRPLVLASASPRRRELLSLLSLPFEIVPSLAEEDICGPGEERVRLLALRKAQEVAGRRPESAVLAADTLVCVQRQVLGKPVDEADAARMLTLLSAKEHQVHTGVCLLLPGQEPKIEVCTTLVSFVALSEETIRRYIATGEPMDKAGAYALQGRAGAFVSAIHGSPSNVIGLPMETVFRLLQAAGYTPF